ncbi:hypothetical protein Tco_0914751 [Tanacetum coccineum]
MLWHQNSGVKPMPLNSGVIAFLVELTCFEGVRIFYRLYCLGFYRSTVQIGQIDHKVDAYLLDNRVCDDSGTVQCMCCKELSLSGTQSKKRIIHLRRFGTIIGMSIIYREDNNEAAFAVAIMRMCSATVAKNAVTTAMAITRSIHQATKGLLDKAKGNVLGIEIVRDQSGNTLRVSHSRFYIRKLVQTLLEGQSILSLKGSLSGDCDVEKNGKWSCIYAVGSQEYQVVCTRIDIAFADLVMLDKFDHGLQIDIQVFVDFDYAMGRSITIMGRSITSGKLLEISESYQANTSVPRNSEVQIMDMGRKTMFRMVCVCDMKQKRFMAMKNLKSVSSGYWNGLSKG